MLYLVLVVLVLIVLVLGVAVGLEGFPVIFGCFFAVISVFHFFTLIDHCDDLAIIKNSQSIIAVHTQAIEDLDRQMDGLNKSIGNQAFGNQALLNADSPYRSLINAKAEYITNLSEAKLRIVQAKTNITARKLGMMSYIVRWYGEE